MRYLLFLLCGALLLSGCRVYPPTVAGHVARYGAANTPPKPAKLNRRF